MKISKKNHVCLKCGNTVRANSDLIDVTKAKLPEKEPIFVAKDSRKDALEKSKKCSQCGNDRAIYWVSIVSGEHAGVRQERTVEHYRCTKCQHTWAETR